MDLSIADFLVKGNNEKIIYSYLVNNRDAL